MLKVKIEQVPDFIKLARKAKTNILVVGNPGVGKSQVIEGMRNDKCKVITMTGSSIIEEYINGIPQVDKVDNILDYIGQKWVKEMEDFSNDNPDGTIVFHIDEFNTADPQVLKTLLTILAERRIPTLNKELPENVVIVASMNPNDQNDTEPLIRPMASRFMVLNIISTIDSYRDYIRGESSKSVLDGILSNEEDKLTVEQIEALLDQITDEEWNNFEQEGNKQYHEINSRSFTNFTRAMGWVKDKKKACTPLSEAFFGKKIFWVEDVKKAEEARARKVENGKVVATEEELRAMTPQALEQYYEQISKPNVTGAAYMKCRLLCKKIMKENELKKDL